MLEFVKMHGLGNDFVLVNALSSVPDTNLPELARQICNRRLGIGGDGLILILPSKVADVRMQIFNSDGSEPEICGNGIRCFAKFVYEQGLVRRNPLFIETGDGVRETRMNLDEDKVTGVRVDMKPPRLNPLEIPVYFPGEKVVSQPLEGTEQRITTVSMGNPHCIIFVQDVDQIALEQIGPKLECHPAFPRRTNVEFVQVVGKDELRMRVWERGAGVTMACGSGACATVAAAVLNGLTGRNVVVHLDGGDLQIEWSEEDGHIYMTGPATYAFSGTWNG